MHCDDDGKTYTHTHTHMLVNVVHIKCDTMYSYIDDGVIM